MCFTNQERNSVPLLSREAITERSDVSVKVCAVARFAFVNESLRTRRIVQIKQ